MTMKDARKFLQSVTNPEALKEEGYVPVSKWGKDHWSLLGYVGCRVSDNEGFMDGRHLRCKPDRIGIQRAYGQGWSPKSGTRLYGYFDNPNDKTLHLTDHDDIDCLQDMEAEGLVLLGTTVSMFVQLTAKGREFEEALRRFKQDKGNFAQFPETNEFKALLLKYTA